MKKSLCALMAVAVLLFSFPAFAATKNQANLTTAQIDQLNQIGAPSSVVTSRQTMLGTALNDVISSALGDGATGSSTTGLISNGRIGGLTWSLASSSTGGPTSSAPYTLLLKYVGGAGTSVDNAPGITLPNGLPGQFFTVQIVGLMTSGTFIITPTTCTGYSSVTFDSKGDTVTFLYDGTLGWIITANGGAVINQST